MTLAVTVAVCYRRLCDCHPIGLSQRLPGLPGPGSEASRDLDAETKVRGEILKHTVRGVSMFTLLERPIE